MDFLSIPDQSNIIEALAVKNKGDGCSVTPHPPSSDGDEVPICSRTSALVEGLVLLVRHWDAPQDVVDSLSSQIMIYLNDAPNEVVWLKRTKYVLTYPLAKHLKNPLPSPPDRVFQPTGKFRSWMKPRICVYNRTNTHLWYSWFQAKRCTLPLSEDVIEKTYNEHLMALTRKDVGHKETIRAIFKDETFLLVLDTIKRCITRELKDYPQFDHSPSTRACFTVKRSGGGQATALDSECGLMSDYGFENPSMDKHGPEDLSRYLAFDDLYYMSHHPIQYTRESVLFNVVRERRGPPGASEWFALRTQARSLAYQMEKYQNPLDCTIQGILEPNKVRVISKGEALPYYSNKPLQVALHDCMRTMPCFRLIGRPFCPTDVLDLVKRAQPSWKWFSVDYSAATDNLSYAYSGKILRYLIRDLPRDQQDAAQAVLGPHNLNYPLPCGGVVQRGVMASGQLMGSILSFPILCLANLGVYLITMKRVQSSWTHREILSHVLVNGDDMVYAAPESRWDQHINYAKCVGLEMSVGKAYKHYSYLNVNSTSCIYDLRTIGGLRKVAPWQISYLNTGLFFAREWKKDSKIVSEGLTSTINGLLEGCRPGRSVPILTSFLARHTAALADETAITICGKTRHRNLFIPCSFGGMGVVCPPGFKFFITQTQMKIAQARLDQVTAGRSFGYVLPGYPCAAMAPLQLPWRKRPIMTFNILDEIKVGYKANQVARSLRNLYSENFSGGLRPFCPNKCSIL